MILVIDNNKKLAQATAAALGFMGVLAHGTSPEESFSEISNLYNAVLLTDTGETHTTDELVQKLGTYTSAPIFSVQAASPSLNHSFNKRITTYDIVKKIIDEGDTRGKYKVGEYCLGGLNASCCLGGVKFFFQDIPLTFTETMILRFLLHTYPEEQRAASILKYVFKESRRPEPSSVRTHVASINKKSLAAIGARMISSTLSHGYSINTPELTAAALRLGFCENI